MRHSSLQLFSTEHKNLAANQSVEVFPLSKDWDEGTGRFSNLPISSNGCSWLYTDNSISKNKWLTSNFFQPLASINYDIDSEAEREEEDRYLSLLPPSERLKEKKLK